MNLKQCIVTVSEFYFNFNNLKYSVCKYHVYFVFTSRCMCVYSFHQVQWLFKTSSAWLSRYKPTEIISCGQFKNSWMIYTRWIILQTFLAEKLLKSLAFLYQY